MMLATAVLLLVASEQDPAPVYDGARDFATAIEAAVKEDPKLVETLRPFATGFWTWRAEQLKGFKGSYFVQELLACGRMIEIWDERLGKDLRLYALSAIVEDTDKEMPALLQSDIRLTYVTLMAEHTKNKDAKAAMFDAGARLAELTQHMLFAEFVPLKDLREGSAAALKACGTFATERPEAPEAMKAMLGEIGAKGTGSLFSVLTMRDIGLLHAKALAAQLPEKHRWQIPPAARG
jgi:hypothetical protein